jgi:D-alanyl-D-alanine carboxypeptidase/D-alanyl-D-alanine-endopeptidase (penicillin-binding protein 4)
MLVGLLSAVLVLVLALVGLVVVRPGPIAGWLGSDPSQPSAMPEPSEPAPSPVLGGAAIDAPVPTAEGVRSAIDALVHDAGLGSRVNASVVDATTGDTLYASGANVPTTPASITKLITAATALEARGPAYRIKTRVVAGTRPGEVVLIGGGDPTLAVNGNGGYPGVARLDRLAARVKVALGGLTPTRVIVDSSLYSGPLFGPGWDPDIVSGGFAAPMTALMTDGGRINPKDTSNADRYAQPDLAAGRAFATALGLSPSAVAATARGSAPEGAASATPAGTGVSAPGAELGAVESPPMIRLVELMLSESDNVVAEALARQVALAKKEPASYAGGAAAMDAELADLGLDPDQARLSDGSGLSRQNRITPALLTDLLSLAASGHQRVAGLFGGLPVAGWSGTLKDRFRTPAEGSRAGAGVVRAKTGTLNRVNTVAGIVQTAEGRLLAFAVLADQVPSPTLDAQTALDRLAARLATCGCR